MERAARNQIKKMKALDLEFANEMLTGVGEEVDKSAPKRWRAEAAAEKAEAFRNGEGDHGVAEGAAQSVHGKRLTLMIGPPVRVRAGVQTGHGVQKLVHGSTAHEAGELKKTSILAQNAH